MKKNYRFKYEWLIVVLGMVFALRSTYGIWKLWRTRDLVKDAQTRLEKTKLENKKLTEKLSEIESPEFIEREAREKLGLGKPGETILILPNQDANPKSQIPNPNKPIWREWWDLYIRI